MKRLAALTLLSFVCAGASPPALQTTPATGSPAAFAPSPLQAALLDRARAAGATELAPAGGPAGGMILHGKLDGRAFVLAIPANWGGETMLFATGYATPGAVAGVPADPVAKDPGGGLFQYAYGEGIALGIPAYDKTGIATQSATARTMRLRGLTLKLGATRLYAVGGSMGGGTVLSLIEHHPDGFEGAVAMCGVTQGWLALAQQMADMRAAYNLLTEGTPYALPGEKDVTRSALPVVPPAGSTIPGDTFREQQKMKLLSPILSLFQAAKRAPDGKEARIIRQVAAIGGFAPDAAALAAPLYSSALGMDDIAATMGGIPVGNLRKTYAPPEMSAAERRAFNRRIQRFRADPRAVAYAREWHEATGRFRTALVTVHQTIDSLVPYSQAEALARIVAKAGNGARHVHYAVPPTRFALPGGLDGYTHCGFTPQQNIAAFEAMRAWVRTGNRPGPEAVK